MVGSDFAWKKHTPKYKVPPHFLNYLQTTSFTHYALKGVSTVPEKKLTAKTVVSNHCFKICFSEQ